MKTLALALLLLPNLKPATLESSDKVAVRVLSAGEVIALNALSLEETKGELERNSHPEEGEPEAYSTLSLVPGIYVLKGEKFQSGIGEACQMKEQVVEITKETTDIKVETVCWED